MTFDDNYRSQLEVLEKALKSEGLADVAESLEDVKLSVKNNVLKDMDTNKPNILNDIELSLLSREFPDKLVLYQSLLNDPQLLSAIDLLKDKQRYHAILSPPSQ